MNAIKPPLDMFIRAMLYDAERTRLGIPLDAFEARALLGDEVALTAYYSSWRPDFRAVSVRNRPRLVGAQKARAAAVLLGSGIVAVLTIAAGVLAAMLAFHMVIGPRPS